MMALERDPTSLVVLTDEELDYFRFTCALFPLVESPLRGQREADLTDLADLANLANLDEPPIEATYETLRKRGLIGEDGAPTAGDLEIRLSIVAECDARVSLVFPGASGERRRDFFAAAGRVVEYRKDGNAHEFGAPMSEAELTNEIHRQFTTKPNTTTEAIELSAGEYLVFAVLARDLRSTRDTGGNEKPMSVEEVLSYFDEPETKYVRTPSDDSWHNSVKALCKKQVLVERTQGYELHPSFHAVAKQLVADNQQTLARYDFLDETWLIREVHLYPTADTVYRIGTKADGVAVIEELSSAMLQRRVASVVMTLPKILASASPPPATAKRP